jgi:D-psicose/D-tagatose/L-ribulose 3-epimerase
MNKVGIYFAYWTKSWAADFSYYIQKVSKLGFDILEICPAGMLDMSKVELDNIKKTANDEGIELTYCIGFPKGYDLSSESLPVRQNGIEYAKRILKIIHFMDGKIFGGINYACWPGDLNEGIVDKRPYLERSIESIKEVIKIAEDYDITYCLEVVNRFEQFLINTAEEGVAFVDAVGSPNLKLLLDAFHMNIEEDDIGQAIITAGNKLGHFHIGETNRKPPGKGRMPWDEIISALSNIDYKGAIVMEPFVKMGGEVGKDIKMWRDLSNMANEEQLDHDAKNALEFIRNKIGKAQGDE